MIRSDKNYVALLQRLKAMPEHSTPGQMAYETDCRKYPVYIDGTPRKSWSELHKVAQLSWERNPTPRGRFLD